MSDCPHCEGKLVELDKYHLYCPNDYCPCINGDKQFGDASDAYRFVIGKDEVEDLQ